MNDSLCYITPSGIEIWKMGSVLHREDGPAVRFPDGRCCYYLRGRCLLKQEWFEALSEEQQEKLLFIPDVMAGK